MRGRGGFPESGFGGEFEFGGSGGSGEEELSMGRGLLGTGDFAGDLAVSASMEKGGLGTVNFTSGGPPMSFEAILGGNSIDI